MKKNKSLLFITLVTASMCLAFSLTGCMSIAMRKSNVVKRVQEAKYTVSYLPSTAWTVDNQKDGIFIDEIILAKKGVDTELTQVYIFACKNDAASKWVEGKCSANTANNENPLYKDYVVYKYDKIVLYGDFASVSTARGY